MGKSEDIIRKQFDDMIRGFDNPHHIERVLVTKVVFDALSEHAGYFDSKGYPRCMASMEGVWLFYCIPDHDNVDVLIVEDDSLTAFFQDWQVVWKLPAEQKLSEFELFEKMVQELPNVADVIEIRVSPTLYRRLEQQVRMMEKKLYTPDFFTTAFEWVLKYYHGYGEPGTFDIVLDKSETLYRVVYREKPEEVLHLGNTPSNTIMKLSSPIPSFEEIGTLHRSVYVRPYTTPEHRKNFEEAAKTEIARALIADFEASISTEGSFKGYHRDVILLSPVKFKIDTPMEWVRRAEENHRLPPDEHLVGTMTVYRKLEVSHTTVEVEKPKNL